MSPRALAASGDDGVVEMYLYELKTAERHRHAEFITVRDGTLVKTQAAFGGRT